MEKYILDRAINKIFFTEWDNIDDIYENEKIRRKIIEYVNPIKEIMFQPKISYDCSSRKFTNDISYLTSKLYDNPYLYYTEYTKGHFKNIINRLEFLKVKIFTLSLDIEIEDIEEYPDYFFEVGCLCIKNNISCDEKYLNLFDKFDLNNVYYDTLELITHAKGLYLYDFNINENISFPNLEILDIERCNGNMSNLLSSPKLKDVYFRSWNYIDIDKGDYKFKHIYLECNLNECITNLTQLEEIYYDHKFEDGYVSPLIKDMPNLKKFESYTFRHNNSELKILEQKFK